jgi:hypothetical protein
MKYNFSFIQIVNWLFICKQSLDKALEEYRSAQNKEELIKKLKIQKEKLKLVKDILDRKVKLQGVNPEFLRNLKQIKKDYGIE